MGEKNLVSTEIAASGVVRSESCHLTAIHGDCTTTGKLIIHNGITAAGFVAVSFALPAEYVRIEMNPDSWRLDQGCYAEFSSGLVGNFTLSFR